MFLRKAFKKLGFKLLNMRKRLLRPARSLLGEEHPRDAVVSLVPVSYTHLSSQAKPLREFILEMKAAVAPEREIIFGDVPFTGTNLPLEKFDCSQTERDTGFRAQVSFGEGVRRTMEWLKEKEER